MPTQPVPQPPPTRRASPLKLKPAPPPHLKTTPPPTAPPSLRQLPQPPTPHPKASTGSQAKQLKPTTRASTQSPLECSECGLSRSDTRPPAPPRPGGFCAPFLMVASVRLKYDDKSRILREIISQCEKTGYHVTNSIVIWHIIESSSLNIDQLDPLHSKSFALHLASVQSISATLDDHEGMISGPRFYIWRLMWNPIIEECKVA